jgi:protocatechuate 3,4-dioxygenase beta subunit
VVGGNGEPLRRVTVALAAVKSGDSSGTDAGSAITGDNGEFVFTGLGPARYRLLAEKSGYVIGHLPRARALIAVGSGEEVKDVVLHLVPVAVVEGRILDGNGEPLAKAVVRLLQYRYMAGRRRLGVVREVLSDERGEFRMGDLDPGPYYLVASHRSSISESVCPPLYYPEVSSFDQAEPIHLRPGDDTPVKFILLPGKPVRVRGRVFGARTGAVQVLVAPRGGIPYAEPLKGGYRDGAFEFGKVLPGSYWVIAIDEAGDEILEGRTTLQVEQNDVKAVEVRLAPRHALSRLAGSVFCDCWPRVPLSGVTITLSPPAVLSEDDWETEGSGESAQADWTGHFALETASRGRYFVSASGFRAEMEDGYLSNVYLGGKDVASEGLRLPLEGVFTQLSVTLSPKGARVEGVVTDSHDQPVAGAVVVAVPAPELRQNAGRYARTTSDQNGQFVLHGLAPGDYEVYAWEDVPEGAYYDPDYLQGFAANAQTLHATKEGRHQLILHVIPAEAE